MRAISEFSSCSATRESSPTPEPAEPATAAPTPPSSSAPAAPTALTQDPERHPKQTAATEDQKQDHDRNDPSERDHDWCAIVLSGRRHRVFRTGQRDPELGGERLRDEVDAKRQTVAVVFRAERRQHGVPDPADARIGEKSLGATARSDEDIAGAR